MRCLIGQKVEAVIALGTAADAAWNAWKESPAGNGLHGGLRPVHPSHRAREFFEVNDKTKLAEATKKMLANWNAGLQIAISLRKTS